jgi:hypothetical protein
MLMVELLLLKGAEDGVGVDVGVAGFGIFVAVAAWDGG